MDNIHGGNKISSSVSTTVSENLSTMTSTTSTDTDESRNYFIENNQLDSSFVAKSVPPVLQMHDALVDQYSSVGKQITPLAERFMLFADQKLHDIIPKLCEQHRVEDIAANLVFYGLDSLDTKAARAAFRSDVYTCCSALFESHHVQDGAECIFGILNERVLRKVSPTLRATKREKLRQLILEGFSKWVWLNRDAFGNACINSLFRITGANTFVKLVEELELNVRQLTTPNLNALLYQLLEEKPRNIFGAFTVVFSTY